ncbi:hypothetical protein [Bacillus phage SP8]|uniref:Uncharacterized protein n=1 Tax=Bacillus phage Adastra TaxID=3143958 RepID=A0AAU8BD73_9CAUD|nr:hypothetical protein [Bacillus phage SP8]
MTGVDRNILEYLAGLTRKDKFSDRVKDVINAVCKSYRQERFEIILLNSAVELDTKDPDYFYLKIDAITDTSDSVLLTQARRAGITDIYRIVHLIRENEKIKRLHLLINYPGRSADDSFHKARGDNDVGPYLKVVDNLLEHIMYETQKEVLTNEIIDAGLKDPEAVVPLLEKLEQLEPPKEKLYTTVGSKG